MYILKPSPTLEYTTHVLDSSVAELLTRKLSCLIPSPATNLMYVYVPIYFNYTRNIACKVTHDPYLDTQLWMFLKHVFDSFPDAFQRPVAPVVLVHDDHILPLPSSPHLHPPVICQRSGKLSSRCCHVSARSFQRAL